MYNPFSLSRKQILVTGASSGIGKSAAQECSKMGAKLIITGRNESRLLDTYKSLEGTGHEYVLADLLNENNVRDLEEKLPVLDGIVFCAGIMDTVPFPFIKRERLEKIMNVNFMNPSLMLQSLLKLKKVNKGASIVFVSSVSGVVNSALGNSMYSASKGALNGMVKGMALDLASKKIRVNTVNPAMVQTSIYEGGAFSGDQFEIDKKKYPLGRYGEPSEIAYGIIYLLSDASTWTTGTNLILDGGYTLL